MVNLNNIQILRELVHVQTSRRGDRQTDFITIFQLGWKVLNSNRLHSCRNSHEMGGKCHFRLEISGTIYVRFVKFLYFEVKWSYQSGNGFYAKMHQKKLSIHLQLWLFLQKLALLTRTIGTERS